MWECEKSWTLPMRMVLFRTRLMRRIGKFVSAPSAWHRGCGMPSLSIKVRSVLGWTFRIAPAPLGPLITHPVLSSVRRKSAAGVPHQLSNGAAMADELTARRIHSVLAARHQCVLTEKAAQLRKSLIWKSKRKRLTFPAARDTRAFRIGCSSPRLAYSLLPPASESFFESALNDGRASS
jgi:hypothetical protein